jgi:nicotinamidase-related amidase
MTSPYSRHPLLLSRHQSVLVVIDMQEPFLNVMYGREALVANVALLCQVARIVGVPILTTTQNSARLGSTVPAIAEIVGAETPMLDKLSFSCVASSPFREVLTTLQRRQVLLCGVETHICVCQTAADLLESGYSVHVAPDAVSARTVERHKLGMERIRDLDILPISAEAAVYEWLEQAGTAEFKQILPLVR